MTSFCDQYGLALRQDQDARRELQGRDGGEEPEQHERLRVA